MKAILIDPAECSIRAIETPAELADLHSIIQCDAMDSCMPFGRQVGEVFYVDDYGMLRKPPKPHFLIRGYHWPVYGRAVVLGFDKAGKEHSTNLTVEWLHQQIIFP